MYVLQKKHWFHLGQANNFKSSEPQDSRIQKKPRSLGKMTQKTKFRTGLNLETEYIQINGTQ